jgi:hypothetical protein
VAFVPFVRTRQEGWCQARSWHVEERNDFMGWGQSRNAPILRLGSSEIACDFDPHSKQVEVRYRTVGLA